MPVAERITEEVLCLPIYPDLEIEAVETICEIVKSLVK
jgi:dTDP-4-amino-4,6-dideoxygalactose transaminase